MKFAAIHDGDMFRAYGLPYCLYPSIWSKSITYPNKGE